MKTSELFGPSKSPKPVLGIAEWVVYYANFDVLPQEDAVEQTVDAHEAVGIHHLVWAIGRAVVDYHSDNPRNTLLGELGPDDRSGDSPINSALLRLTRGECQFRRAIRVCQKRGMKFWGRLCMNRYYNHPYPADNNSRFGTNNPQYWERTRGGKEDRTRLCYAFDEVQEERLGILTEVQQLGVDGLLLDFCRQPPITRYHPRWIELYLKSGGQDPRSWTEPALDQLMPWYQFRADVVTQFMRELRKRVRAGEAQAGRKCPIIARVSATSLLSNLAAGLDVATWMREDLADGVMLSPLVFCPQATELTFEDYVKVTHQHGKACIGGLGSLDLHQIHVPANTGFFRPEPMYRLLDQQYAAGVDAMSVYQSESLARMGYLREHLPLVGDPAAVKARAVPGKDQNEWPWIGYDWHNLRDARPSVKEGRFTGYDLTSSGDNAL